LHQGTINNEVLRFLPANANLSQSSPQGIVDTSSDEPICYVRVDKNYFLKLLKGENTNPDSIIKTGFQNSSSNISRAQANTANNQT
jgi:hypothetical protein